MMSGRVLVADDDEELLQNVSSVLASAGMVVVQARDGGEALSEVAEGGLDLIVTDVSMPGLDGVQLSAMARVAGEQVPILIMTASREPWIAAAVERLQRSALLQKPFSPEELLEKVRALVDRTERSWAVETRAEDPHLFPPALVAILRARLGARQPSLEGVDDIILTELLSVVFFAGLDTEEGMRNPVRVIFTGGVEPPMTGTEDPVTAPLQRWSSLGFDLPRPCSIDALVKLAVAHVSPPFFTEVQCRDGRLMIVGLARERVNLEGDSAIKIVAPRPGDLSVRIGKVNVLDYERGRVNASRGGDVFSHGIVRRQLDRAAFAAGVPASAMRPYLDVVRGMVVKLCEHGRGGILAVGCEEAVELRGESDYGTSGAASPVSLILSLQASELQASELESEAPHGDPLSRGAVMADIARLTNEVGALSALDGATLVTGSLRLAGFGVVMPIDDGRGVVEARDPDATIVRPFDLGTRGTRHRAAAAYARSHPTSVVFVGSADGHLGCFCGDPYSERVILWRFRPADFRR